MINPLELKTLIRKLEAWSDESGSFHTDRQLADEVLIADGWRVVPDPSFEGGFCWKFGVNPVVSSSESYRPHPVNDLNAAIAVIPHNAHWRLEVKNGVTWAYVWPCRGLMPEMSRGQSCRPAVAILVAALNFKQTSMVGKQ
ncbi:hypothetical protein [Zavarzinella formosa]|uniref:hypothetical protein n=1 Tax=Zavarzinella formosa TaxID=360055 RepID=UPI000375C180|nr:hypothetical protein [Zavarzinella formosa]